MNAMFQRVNKFDYVPEYTEKSLKILTQQTMLAART